MTEQNGKPVSIALNLQVEASPCKECGVPFMLVCVGAKPVGGAANPLIVPHKKDAKGQDTIPLNPIVAWRLCMHCLHREVTMRQGNVWVTAESMTGLGVAPAMQPIQATREEPKVLEFAHNG